MCEKCSQCFSINSYFFCRCINFQSKQCEKPKMIQRKNTEQIRTEYNVHCTLRRIDAGNTKLTIATVNNLLKYCHSCSTDSYQKPIGKKEKKKNTRVNYKSNSIVQNDEIDTVENFSCS